MDDNDYSLSEVEETTPPEFEYLKNLIDYRLNNPSGNNIPQMPAIENWYLPVKNFIKEHHFENDQAIATILLIALVHHADGELFDHAIQDKLKTSGDFPEIGGVRGKNFRGFLPTGQTAVYLLAGDNLEKRKEVMHLFWSDQFFAKKKILWLEELIQGEPNMSGRIIMSQDYIDTFIHGKPAPPHFSISFPAKLIETELSWDDLVINNELKEQIKELESWIIHNDELMIKWGMQNRLRKGYRTLFYGSPGTGKTFTAGLLGKYTNKDVYKIDLSMIVSKYIGETEKNLELLFARAEDKGWILFFDEADALFGKRTSVRDAHDKYANQEVSYLLQRIEDYNGLIILATNMKNNIDDAFIRRFNSILKFPFPDAAERALIWEKSFPKNAVFLEKPNSKPEESNEANLTDKKKSQPINIPESVKKYELSGGNIINVIHYASLKAVERKNTTKYSEGEAEIKDESILTIYLVDILNGIRREMIKEGKPFNV